MTDTPNLTLPYLAPSQAQKHVTHNEALRALDAIVQLSVLDRDRAAPPATPEDGARYIIAGSATGDWADHAHDIAAFQDGTWAFYPPREGWRTWIIAENKLVVWDGTEWVDTGGGATGSATLLGVNTTADSTNKLAVKSDAALFSHDDVTPGSGDIRAILNKASEPGTASVLLQDNWSGRAEIGLTGDDDLHVKVSDDGTIWKEAMTVGKDTGLASFPSGILHAVSGQRPQAFVAVPGSNHIFRIDGLHDQNPRAASIGSISDDVITLTTNDSDMFFTHYLRDISLVRVWNMSKSPAESAWIKNNPAGNGSDQLQATDPSMISGWASGDALQVGDPTSITPGRVVALDISPMLINQFGRAFRQTGVLAKYYISGDTNALTSLQTTSIGITPSGAPGTFNNALSNNQGIAGIGILYVPCSQLSPVSDSNLIFVREGTPASGNTIGTSLISILGLMVEM